MSDLTNMVREPNQPGSMPTFRETGQPEVCLMLTRRSIRWLAMNLPSADRMTSNLWVMLGESNPHLPGGQMIAGDSHTELVPCLVCEGRGWDHAPLYQDDGRLKTRATEVCRACHGAGVIRV